MSKKNDNIRMRDVFAEYYENSAKVSESIRHRDAVSRQIKQKVKQLGNLVADLTNLICTYLAECFKMFHKYEEQQEGMIEQCLRLEAEGNYYREQLEMYGHEVEEPSEEYIQNYISHRIVQPTKPVRKLIKGIRLRIDTHSLEALYCDLIQSRLIASTTKKDHFIAAFKGNQVTEKIQWTGFNNELVAFMNILKRHIDNASGNSIWKRTSELFVDRNGRELSPAQLDKTRENVSERIRGLETYFE